MEETERGYKWVLICIERFSKWCELVPLPDKTSERAADAFAAQVLTRFRAPGEVVTDQGREFQGRFRDLITKHEITHRLASREHPQADGLAERMVQTIKRGLRKCLLQGGGEQWDRLLPYVAMGYRFSKQKSIFSLLHHVWSTTNFSVSDSAVRG